ncbi:peroxiredoxin family protein [Candidatus Poriferisodalis sp.]|uniref:peroxiredoxin family protein n=1 Tax=Candidatus Poriferisodalis sp. TaxID=3101277 RepID=UPI003B52A17F
MGIPGRDTKAAMSRFVSTYGVGNMPHLPDENGDLAAQLGVSYHPRWLLIRADGTVERGGGVPPDNIVQDALTPG